MTRAHRQVAFVLLLLICPGGRETARAQQPPNPPDATTRPEYVYPDQVDALNAYVEDSQTQATPARLVELSRLLGNPADQIVWLSERVKSLSANNRDADARQLRELAIARIDHWIQRDIDLQNLRGLFPPLVEPLLEITDAARLAERCTALDPRSSEVASLSAADQFTLLARGVPPALLGVRRRILPVAPWDQPRVVLLRLGAETDGRLPPIWEALDLDRALRTARGQAASGGAGAPPSPRVDDTFRIAAALLGRALGLDGAARGVPVDDGPDYWQGLADELQADDVALWQWAAAARVLQAACTSSTDQVRGLAEQGRTQLDKARTVAATATGRASPSAAATLAGWLDRLQQSGGLTTAEGYLPLSPGFRNAAEQARRQAETAFEEAWRRAQAGDAGALNEAFQLMQQAKAAELPGLPANAIQPVSISDLEDWLSDTPIDVSFPGIHMFLEVLQTGRGVYGLAMCSEKGTCSTGDTWVVRALGPSPTLQKIITDALGVGGRYSEGRVLYAPDGEGRSPAGLTTADQLLLPRINPDNPRSWAVYLPSAAALRAAGAWTAERTLRLWYGSLVAGLPAGQAPDLEVLRRGGQPRDLLSPRRGRQTVLNAVSVGSPYPRLRSTNNPELIQELLKEKKSGQAPNVILIAVSRSGPGG